MFLLNRFPLWNCLFPMLILSPITSLNGNEIPGTFENIQSNLQQSLDEYLLPADHPLQKKLINLFQDPDMFENGSYLRKANFKVADRSQKTLMVAKHPSLKKYLIKKHNDSVSRKDQLKNYLKRISGARALRDYIRSNRLKYITVPKKWLYELPGIFSDPTTGEKSYILIVEDMKICSGGKDPNGEVAKRYFTIDDKILKEICMVVYTFRGLDSMLHNLPFTHSNKIAFIDTEKWQKKRDGYLENIEPFLNQESRKYAKGVFKKLEGKKEARQ